MAPLDYAIFDADNHYYEAEDAFIRHIDPRMRKRCMQWGEVDGRKRLLVPLPCGIAKLKASVLGLLPKPLLTMDQVELLKSDNIVSEAAVTDGRTLEGLGIAPQGVDAIVPGYLYRYRKAGQFTRPTHA